MNQVTVHVTIFGDCMWGIEPLSKLIDIIDTYYHNNFTDRSSPTYLMCSAISFKGLGNAVSLTSLNRKKTAVISFNGKNILSY